MLKNKVHVAWLLIVSPVTSLFVNIFVIVDHRSFRLYRLLGRAGFFRWWERPGQGMSRPWIVYVSESANNSSVDDYREGRSTQAVTRM